MERKDILVSSIEPNQFNPNVMSEEEFKSLKEDMKTTGPKHDLAIDRILVSPKNVFYNDPKAEPDIYVIVDGEHRWKAAKELEWNSVPCEIGNIGEELAKAMNYRRNKERGTIDPIKEAALFKAEIDKGLTQEAVARKYNVSRPYVANRLGLTQLEKQVVKMYREPNEAFKETQLRKHQEALEDWKELQNQEEGGYSYMSEPEELSEEDFVPRGTLSASHLEVMATLPKEKQVELAETVLERDVTVRETEGRVKRIKNDIAREKRFKVALEKAKRPKCPSCGGDPEDFAYSDESRFKCGATACYNKWEYMKTRKEVEAERVNMKQKVDKETAERFKQARENPRYIRMLDTPEELHEKVKPWLLRKVQELTEIDKVRVWGKRGDEVVEIDYREPSRGYQRMDLTFKVGDRTFGFNVEEKHYKKFEAKSRVDMDWNMKPTEKSRQILRHFFAKIVQTDKDPTDVSDEELEELAHWAAVEKGTAVDIGNIMRHQKT